MLAARLGVNVDHVATLRQARRVRYPDPVTAAALAELGGADQITLHLREDRRHIQDRDLRILRETVKTVLRITCRSRSWMWRRSSRRWMVIWSAPAISACSAAATGSGYWVRRSWRTVAT